MKKILTMTALVTITTASFGAASLRAPQMGGTATVATPTATNTARAGTLRTQTMKTSSISTPSVTTTQSVATPVSTETTDARIALLKGIKGFNPGKIKDTTTAQQELNNINSQIEELQSKLDQAEAAADQTAKLTDVYTKEQVEAKIDEKLSALGTSTSAKDTYSKAEVDNLLTALEKKLPKIDDKGNMTWTDEHGNSIKQPISWINLEYTVNLSFDISEGFDYGTFYMYRTNKTNTQIQKYISSTVCNGETSDWCWINEINDTNPDDKTVSVIRLKHHYDAASNSMYWGFNPLTPLEQRDTTHTIYWTFENSPETYVRNAVCGTKPADDCFVATGNMQAFGGAIANGITFNAYGDSSPIGTFVEIVERGQHTGNNFENSLGFEGFHLVNQYMVSASSNVTESEINTYVNEFCDSESDFYCYILNGEITTLSTGTKQFVIIKRLHGYGLLDSHIIHDNNGISFNKIFYTNEANPDTYIRDVICGNKPQTECYIKEYWDMVQINNNLEPGSGEKDARYQVSVIEVPIAPNPDPGTATSGYIPLR